MSKNLPKIEMPVYLKNGDGKYRRIAVALAQEITCGLDGAHSPNDFYRAVWKTKESIFNAYEAYVNNPLLELKVFPTLYCGFFIDGRIDRLEIECQYYTLTKTNRVDIRIYNMKPFKSKKNFFL